MKVVPTWSNANFWTKMKSPVSQIALGLVEVGSLVTDLDVLDVFFCTSKFLNIFFSYIFVSD